MLQPDTQKAFFILSCARSGSTSLTRILDMATNGTCVVEPAPNLNLETREMMDGRLDDPFSVLRQTVFPRVVEGLSKFEIYGEKNLTYGPFVQHIYEELKCRFVFLKRDGRDVVRSLIDWHNRKFGTIYRECSDPGDVTPTALAFAAKLPVYLDSSDYSRPRPMPEESIYVEWENLDRFEMCAYYWQRINNLYLDQLNELPENAWITLDYTDPGVEDVQHVINFLGLKGINEDAIFDLLHRRINSLSQRGVFDGSAFPQSNEWPNDYRRKFAAIAGETMTRLKYW
jgi:hypothetical protein